MTTQEIKSLLNRHQIIPLKSLSQNFFIDAPLLTKILKKAKINTKDHIIEIGPGLGSLTLPLLEMGCSVTAFEIDKGLASILPKILKNPPQLKIYHQDILESDTIFTSFTQPYKVVANIPYHITGAIIQYLLTRPLIAESITLLIQKEVARRITTKSSSYTLQKLAIQLYGDIRYLMSIPKESFYPRPNVDSAVIQIIPNSCYQTIDREGIITFAKPIFQRKRKQIAKSLHEVYGISQLTVMDFLTQTQIHPQARPESLLLEDWINLYTCYVSKNPQR